MKVLGKRKMSKADGDIMRKRTKHKQVFRSVELINRE